MKPKHIQLLLAVLVACGTAAAQSAGELQIPVENDNQFPPDDHAESDGVVEGSGEGIVDTTTDASPPPELEQIDAPKQSVETSATPSEEISCPKQCVCNVEGESNLLTVNCAGYDLTEFPSPIDEKTSILNLKDNKLTEIPKSVSTLKNLKTLNAENNQIMEISPGSVSELPELKVLNLAKNRLIEYPNDLKNSFGLTKLEEIDLGGNDIRTTLNSETFSNFQSLRKLTLPISTPELNEDICNKLKSTLEVVCTGTCELDLHDCSISLKPGDIEDEMLVGAKLPGVIPLLDSEEQPAGALEESSVNENVESGTEETPSDGTSDAVKPNSEIASPVNNFSLRVAVDSVAAEGENIQAEKPEKSANQEATPTNDENVKIGATTSDTKTGGVDKSVIGIIVAAMVVVVAGVTIKKNWSSIKKRFSSTARAANERAASTNGSAAPEEVPLQDKSPV